MQEICRATTLLLILPLLQSLQQYHLFKTVQIDSPSFSGIGYFDDFSSLIIYDNQSSQVYQFECNNYGPNDTWSLEGTSTALDFFTDVRGLNNIIYSTDNQIRQRTFKLNGFKYIDNFLTDIGNAIQLDVSSDGFHYAFLQQNSSKVYIGNTSEFVVSQSLEIRDYSQRGIVTAVAWRPDTHQVTVAGISLTDGITFAELYDYNSKNSLDLGEIATAGIIDLTFSKLGDKLYFIQGGNHGQVKVYDLPSKTTITLNLEMANQIKEIEVKGHILAVSDGAQVQVFNLDSGANYGVYQSVAKSIGLSPDGSDLTTLAANSQLTMQVYKLCLDSHSFFDSSSDQCKACDSTCARCYLQATRCSSCFDQYYLSNTRCLLCSDSIPGCISCASATACSKCDQAQHRTSNRTGGCSCQTGYFQNVSICQKCMDGCLECDSATACISCNEAAHWNISDDKCYCSAGFIAVDSNCQACSTLIDRCQVCTSADTCTNCQPDYTWDESSRSCIPVKHHTLLILLLSVGGFVVLVVIVCVVKRNRRKKLDSLLDSHPN